MLSKEFTQVPSPNLYDRIPSHKSTVKRKSCSSSEETNLGEGGKRRQKRRAGEVRGQETMSHTAGEKGRGQAGHQVGPGRFEG